MSVGAFVIDWLKSFEISMFDTLTHPPLSTFCVVVITSWSSNVSSTTTKTHFPSITNQQGHQTDPEFLKWRAWNIFAHVFVANVSDQYDHITFWHINNETIRYQNF